MMHFEFLIRGQRLSLNNRPRAVGGSINYLNACAVFDGPDWIGAEKWLHFVQDDHHYEINLIDDLITADRGLNLSAGYWIVYVIGHQIVDGEVIQRITTNKITIQLDETGDINGEPFPSVPPSAGEQIIAQAIAARDDARDSADDAADRADEASGHADRAKRFADLANQAAQTHGAFFMDIDANGHLIYTRSDKLDDLNFEMNNGRLNAIYGMG